MSIKHIFRLYLAREGVNILQRSRVVIDWLNLAVGWLLLVLQYTTIATSLKPFLPFTCIVSKQVSIKHLTILSTYKQFYQWKLPATMDWGINTLVWFSTSQPDAIYCGLDGCFRLHEPKRQLLEIVMLVLNCVQENA